MLQRGFFLTRRSHELEAQPLTKSHKKSSHKKARKSTKRGAKPLHSAKQTEIPVALIVFLFVPLCAFLWLFSPLHGIALG
jgi:hypothetical protein